MSRLGSTGSTFTSIPSLERGQACLSKVCSSLVWATNVVGPAVFALQMGVLDLVVWREKGWAWLMPFALLEVCLLTHMLLHASPTKVVRTGSLQWIVYSWLIAAKTGVLYFRILPSLPWEMVLNVSGALCLTPVFYCIVTFRTVREVFHRSDRDTRGSRRSLRMSLPQDRWGEHGTLDVVLLQDMVWHVVIDMVDIVSMLFYANLGSYKGGNSFVDSMLIDQYPKKMEQISSIAGFFIVCGMFFHQQSFPSINFAGSSDSEGRFHRLSTNNSGSQAASCDGMPPIRSPSIPSLGSNWSGDECKMELEGASSRQPPRNGQFDVKQVRAEYGVSVVKARKRSAVVSILLVDLPFFSIRTWMYVLSLWASDTSLESSPSAAPSTAPTGAPPLSPGAFEQQQQQLHGIVGWSALQRSSGDISDAYKPQLDKWWVKNVMCLLLQAMQLRFVQRADLEQSQNLQWMSVSRSEASATRRAARRRRSAADHKVLEQLRRSREEWSYSSERRRRESSELGKLVPSSPEASDTNAEANPAAEYIRANTSYTFDCDAHRNEAVSGGSAAPVYASEDATSTVEVAEDLTAEMKPARGCRRLRRRCYKWCRRRCRFCGLHCTGPFLQLVAQTAAGVVLGWFIAKTNFDDTLTELQVALQSEVVQPAEQQA